MEMEGMGLLMFTRDQREEAAAKERPGGATR